MMEKKNGWVILLLILFVPGGLLLSGLFSVTGNEVITRSFTTPVDPGANSVVTYTVSGVSGNWGCSIIDTMVCPGIANQQKQFVIISDEGTTKTISYTLVNTENTQCSIQGNYQCGSFPIKNFATQTITTKITTISHNSKSCYDNDVYWYNSKNVMEDKYLECGTAGCLNGVCKTQNTASDTNYDGIVSRTELGVSITQWLNNQINRDLLGQIIQAWAI